MEMYLRAEITKEKVKGKTSIGGIASKHGSRVYRWTRGASSRDGFEQALFVVPYLSCIPTSLWNCKSQNVYCEFMKRRMIVGLVQSSQIGRQMNLTCIANRDKVGRDKSS
ncbi:hypothetical protein Bca52824_045585 [Brassica carinata]|uniref:Uncharacterized protein n=1 Tax=Brassica carinata TaxID=52824 RepID=A0A8X7URM2_BRACI|nr:hypothetical protein Bca52824_045585 [Brassica carinata]